MPYRVPTMLELSEAERAELEGWARRRKTAQALALRARIVLRAAAGLSNTAVAGGLGISKHTVGKWRERFARLRADGLLDEPRPGAPRRVGDDRIAALVDRTLSERPEGATHWSLRTMAKASGLSVTTVGRAWRAFGLQPHRAETFKLSTDPLFAEKVRDIVGLYLSPPDRALVLCVDEKSQVQALDRTQPLLPLRPGQAERRTHDYTRHGTTSLFAALDVKAGTVIGRCFPRHRAAEFRRFLDEVDAQVPPDLDIHLVLDNSAAHKTKDPRLAGQAAPLPRPLHADIGLLDQPGRALVRPAHRARDPPGRPPLRRRPRTRHPRLRRRDQRRAEALPPGEIRRRHPRQRQALLPAHARCCDDRPSFGANFGIRTLGVQSRTVVARLAGRRRGTSYGPGSPRQRHHDGGNPSRDAAE